MNDEGCAMWFAFQECQEESSHRRIMGKYWHWKSYLRYVMRWGIARKFHVHDMRVWSFKLGLIHPHVYLRITKEQRYEKYEIEKLNYFCYNSANLHTFILIPWTLVSHSYLFLKSSHLPSSICCMDSSIPHPRLRSSGWPSSFSSSADDYASTYTHLIPFSSWIRDGMKTISRKIIERSGGWLNEWMNEMKILFCQGGHRIVSCRIPKMWK